MYAVNEKYKPSQRVKYTGTIVMASCSPPPEEDEEFLRRLHYCLFLYHDIFSCNGCDLNYSILGEEEPALDQTVATDLDQTVATACEEEEITAYHDELFNDTIGPPLDSSTQNNPRDHQQQ